MTGEMPHIDPKTGEDMDGVVWTFHAAIAEATGGDVKPFDKYQGPYVVVGPDARVGTRPYQVTVPGPVRFWIVDENDAPYVFREDTEEMVGPIFCPEDAASAAMFLLNKKPDYFDEGDVRFLS